MMRNDVKDRKTKRKEGKHEEKQIQCRKMKTKRGKNY